jgi:hypothetical protein
MKTYHPRVTRTAIIVALAALAMFAVSGCSRKLSDADLPTFEMGSQASIGPLHFTALSTEWKDQIDAPNGPLVPKHRWLLINVTITNSGGQDASLPMLTLVDASGTEYKEEEKGDGVSNWLGLMRLLKPADTTQGSLIFDVPAGPYKLKVRSGGDPETEVAVYVKIPFQIDAAPVEKSPI